MSEGLARLKDMFAATKASNRGALMPFLVGGYPRPGGTAELILAADRGGADALEIGFPFSDPIADGPVVAAAMHEALTAGASPVGVIEEIASTRSRTRMPLVAMVSVSIVGRLGGASAFVRRCRDAGFDGFIFPDLPVEESGPYSEACVANSVGCSLLVAPTTPIERVRAIAARSSGFLYVLARAGLTGEREAAPEVGERIEEIRSVTDLPLAVGFGISQPEHVRAVVRHADAAIVGSALVRRVRESDGDPAGVVESFVRSLRPGCDRP